jgi:hypothetical protein
MTRSNRSTLSSRLFISLRVTAIGMLHRRYFGAVTIRTGSQLIPHDP